MLQNGKSIDETCSVCGFDNMEYFTQLFKKITGVTPRKFVLSLKAGTEKT